MASNLQTEIKQNVPFSNLREELWLNLQRTTATLGHALEKQLRGRGLSPTQYNVLRILRGAGANGLCQYEIAGRLVAQVPDVPRILERMEKAGWVGRQRGEQDRRMVMASLTAEGLRLVNELDGPVQEIMGGLFSSMSSEAMKELIDLLVLARK